jgi:hypothetical protein
MSQRNIPRTPRQNQRDGWFSFAFHSCERPDRRRTSGPRGHLDNPAINVGAFRRPGDAVVRAAAMLPKAEPKLEERREGTMRWEGPCAKNRSKGLSKDPLQKPTVIGSSDEPAQTHDWRTSQLFPVISGKPVPATVNRRVVGSSPT